MSSEYQLGLQDYLLILRRRALLLVSIFVGLFLLALAVVVLYPPVYQSTGTIMVESQQISFDLVQAAVPGFAEERIELIKQRVMTRENLLRVIDKYKLFDDRRKSATPSDLIKEMRLRIAVDLVSANAPGSQRANATIAFKISFEDREPQVAYKVANELVTLFLDENAKVRTERAAQTTEFLTQEADKLKVELEALENRIATYKQEHGNALPENMNLVMGSIQRTETELRDVEREYRAAQEELRFLNLELATARAGIGVGSAPGAALSPAQDLERTRAEYARLSSLYTPNHPDVRAAKRKIEQLEKSIASPEGGTSPARTSGDPAVDRVEGRIASAKARAGVLGQQQGALRAKLNAMEREVLKAPQVERGLSSLMRDHQNAQKKYDEIRAKQMTAQVSENLEEDKKAERFILLESPEMPDKPIKPDRKKMIVIGFFLALAASGGLVVMLENINGGVRGVEALESVTPVPILAAIPYIQLDEEIVERQRLIKRVLIVTGVLLLMTLLALHIFYLPLDVLFMKVLVRLG
jgi:polysaccharide chain length determinant protein (PEP-CTERM system associated)